MIQSIDEGVGEVTAALEETGLAGNTVVVFVSDNGGFPFVGGFNYPYRGYKTSVFNGGVKGPAVVSWPGRLPAQPYRGLMHVADWGPTLLGQPGRTGPMDGVDQSAGLLGRVDRLRDD